MRFLPLFLLFPLAIPSPSAAQPNFAPPPPPNRVDREKYKEVLEKLGRLQDALAEVKDAEKKPGYADVAIYPKALDWIVRHDEWFGKDPDKQALAVAEEGLKRAKAWKDSLASKKEWLSPAGKVVARGYISKVDGSVQPYAVSYPAEYGRDAMRQWRLDINLHGRDNTITEVKHLAMNGRPTPKDQDYVQIAIFGRGNNAYRWAGEEDVLEVLGDFVRTDQRHGRLVSVDASRIVLKGFSMGGAGTWHLGLQHPSLWAVMQPGAGFTTTHGYIDKKPDDKFPSPVEETLRIYDAYLYAENAAGVPIVAYSGEIDGQKAAADVMERELKKLGMQMTHIIAPKLAHVAPKGEFTTEIESEFAKYIGPGRGKAIFPEEVRYVTYTLKFPEACSWIKLLALEEHYRKARIRAERRGSTCAIETENIAAFEIPIAKLPFKITGMKIDGKEVPLTAAKTLWFEKRGRDWEQKATDPTELTFPGRKKPHLQGPIDDAFTGTFVCVVPSAKGFHAETDAAARAALDRFGKVWDKFLRGTLPTAKADEIKIDETKNLILFGDPQSNPLIAEVVAKLPLTWTADAIVMAGKKFSSRNHLPALVYPNPLNGGKSLVVIDSGHTFGEAEFNGSNAQLYPRLGDYAVLKWDGNKFEPVLNGLFDDAWKVKP